jgi:hypothetical protein
MRLSTSSHKKVKKNIENGKQNSGKEVGVFPITHTNEITSS